MYYDLQELIFGKAKKLCIAADPSGYGEKTLVSILWPPKMKGCMLSSCSNNTVLHSVEPAGRGND